MPPQQRNGRSAADTARVLADRARENARLRAELADMEQIAKKATKDFCRLRGEIEQAALSTTYFTHAHRKCNGGLLVALAEHLTACSSGTVTRAELAAGIDIAKDVILQMAKQDTTHLIDAAVENLCNKAEMTSYTVAHQVILENEDATGKGDLKDAIEQRILLVRAQENLIWEMNDLSFRQKKRRVAGLPDDITAQLKADPTFDFQHKLVPRVDNVAQEEASPIDSSLADLVRSKLTFEETSDEHSICIVS